MVASHYQQVQGIAKLTRVLEPIVPSKPEARNQGYLPLASAAAARGGPLM